MAAGTTVTIVPCGAMTADLTWLLLAPGRAMRSRQDKDKPAEWVDVPTHTVLVDTPDGKLLWDTSCPRDWEQRWAPTGLQDFFPYDKVSEEEYLDSRLKQLGVSLGDIDYVVLSHLHFDHAGNVRMFKDTDAKLICSDKEKEFAFGYEGAFNGAHLKADYEGLEFDTVSGDVEFLPGVTLHPDARAHARQHVDAGRPARYRNHDLYCGRGVHGRQLRPAAPLPAAIVNNLEQFYTSVEKIRRLATESDATVVFGHDPEPDQAAAHRSGRQLHVTRRGSHRTRRAR